MYISTIVKTMICKKNKQTKWENHVLRRMRGEIGA